MTKEELKKGFFERFEDNGFVDGFGYHNEVDPDKIWQWIEEKLEEISLEDCHSHCGVCGIGIRGGSKFCAECLEDMLLDIEEEKVEHLWR